GLRCYDGGIDGHLLVGDSPGSNQSSERLLDTMAVSDTSAEATGEASATTTGFWALTLGSIGVVFGDIGTSPLYAFREAVNHAAQNGTVTPVIVLGVLSLILWSLFIVVT